MVKSTINFRIGEPGQIVVSYIAQQDTADGWHDDGLAGAVLRLEAGALGTDFWNPASAENTWFDFSGQPAKYSTQGALSAVSAGEGLSFSAASGEVSVSETDDYSVDLYVVDRRQGGSVPCLVFWGVGINGSNPANVLAATSSDDSIFRCASGSGILKNVQAGDTLRLYAKQVMDGAATMVNTRVAYVNWVVRRIN